MKPYSLAAAALLASVALSTGACGGGGSTTPPAPTPTPTMSHSLSCPHTFSAARLPASFARVGSLGMHGPSIDQESIAGGQLAVRFAAGRITPAAAAALSKIGARLTAAPNPQGAATFSFPGGIDPRTVADALRSVPGVLAAGPVIFRHLLSVTPNDPLFPNQWDMSVMQMPSAWAVTTGLPSVKIAIIDTGYDTSNPDLTGKVVASIVFDKGNGKVDNTATILDKDGHGSDVSGIVTANTNNSTFVSGTGWNVRLLEARVFPYGANPSASTQDIAAAINWAVANNAKVINLSLGSATADPTFEEPAVSNAISKGVVVIAAAGNSGVSPVDFPAQDPGVIAVGASAFCDSTKNVQSGFEYVAAYSNFGAGLSLVAPGGDPDAAQQSCPPTAPACVDFLQWIENLDSKSGQFNEYVGLFAGTSQAAPHVAGAVALMVSKDPALTPAQALSIIRSSADNIGDPHMGAGRLNVLNALNQTP